MHRSFGVFAWLLATALSVAVGMAAVNSVRAQVTDGPSVVDLATLRAATSTTTVPDRDGTATPSSVPDRPTVSGRPTPPTTVEVEPTRPAPSPSPSATGPGPVEEELVVLTGGTVRLVVADGVIEVMAAEPAAGFTVSVLDDDPTRVLVSFESPDHVSRLLARLGQGGLEVETREQAVGLPRGSASGTAPDGRQ